MSSNSLSFNFVFDYAGQATQEKMYSGGSLIATVTRQRRQGPATSPSIAATYPSSSATIDSFSYAYDLAGQ